MSKRKTPSKSEVKIPLISTSTVPPNTESKRRKREKKEEEDAPLGVRDYRDESGPKRAPKIPSNYTGTLTILCKGKRRWITS